MPEPFSPSSGLYLVATPIGNLLDITLRALDVLKAADVILCEDTRHSGKLLKAHDIKTPMMSYHDHSSCEDRHKIIEHLEQGKVVALISDAGTPMIADPGHKLVQDVIAKNIPISTIPGANAALSALQLSGLPSHSFMFAGFFPRKESEQKNILESIQNINTTIVFYDAPNRLEKSLKAISAHLGNREIAIARELTKLHEQIIRGNVADVLKEFDQITLKGEMVLCLGPAMAIEYGDEDIKALLEEELKTLRTKEAAKKVASKTGWSVQDVYRCALEIKES